MPCFKLKKSSFRLLRNQNQNRTNQERIIIIQIIIRITTKINNFQVSRGDAATLEIDRDRRMGTRNHAREATRETRIVQRAL